MNLASNWASLKKIGEREMEFFAKSIHTIDLEQEQLVERAAPESFQKFVDELFVYINENKSIRRFRERSINTEVLSAVLQLIDSENDQVFQQKATIIANRLLREEIAVQDKVKNLAMLRKGSFIQAIAREKEDHFMYLLAKVQHSPFIDDDEIILRTGFPKNQKGIWKSCLIFLDKKTHHIKEIKVYSDNGAKYWENGFLEIDPLHSDDENTKLAFSYVDKTINKILKKFPQDRTHLRNNIIAYFKNNDFIDYDIMIEKCVAQINTENVDQETIVRLREELLELPDKRTFDRQFPAVPGSITARIRKIFPISQGIDLRVKDVEGNLYDKIFSIQDGTGKKYLQLAVDEENTYQEFLRPLQL